MAGVPPSERDYGDDEDDRTCEVCGGSGFVHDCGEDCCCCDDPDDDTACEWCGGTGER